jgi:hypothetical protein
VLFFVSQQVYRISQAIKMVVLKKSQSHPDLVFYASPRWSSDSTCSITTQDSESSLFDISSLWTKKEKKNDEDATSSSDIKTIGRLLWQWRLTKKLSRHTTNEDLILLVQEYPEVRVSWNHLQEYHAALSSIIIMDEDIDDRAASLLQDYKGHLVNVRRTMTRELLEQAPEKHMALVADFNDNLAYSMQAKRGIPTSPREVAHLEATLRETLSSPTVQLQASFLKTVHQTIPQPAHVDYPWQTLSEPSANDLFLAFFPLTNQGMILQLWPHPQGTPVAGQLVFIPLDKMLIVPSHTIHGGGFQTLPHDGLEGNVRFHLYIATQGTPLPVCAQNVYTMPQNRRVELSRYCPNAPGLDDSLLMQLLFE